LLIADYVPVLPHQLQLVVTSASCNVAMSADFRIGAEVEFGHTSGEFVSYK
jgi:hypothetical protein